MGEIAKNQFHTDEDRVWNTRLETSDAYGACGKLSMLKETFRQLADVEDGMWIIDRNAFFHGAAYIVEEVENMVSEMADFYGYAREILPRRALTDEEKKMLNSFSERGRYGD